MPLPLTVSCFSKIQSGFTFLVPAHPGSPGKTAVKRVCVIPQHVCLCRRSVAENIRAAWPRAPADNDKGVGGGHQVMGSCRS